MWIWDAFCRFVTKINKISLYLSVAALFIMTTLVMVEIIGRSVFHTSTMIADEYSGYLLCALAMFGGAYTLEHGAFLRVDVLYLKYGTNTKRLMDIINYFFALVFVCIMFKVCFDLFYSNMLKRTVSVFISRTPLVYPQITLLIGWSLLILQIFVHFVNALFFPDRLENESEEVTHI